MVSFVLFGKYINTYLPLPMSIIIYQEQLPMERLSLSSHTNPISFIIFWLVQFFFFQVIVLGMKRVYRYFSRSQSFMGYQVELLDGCREVVAKVKHGDFVMSEKKSPCLSDKIDDGSLSGEEVEMVMERFGIFCHPLQERFGSDNFSRLFEEKEPSLDEVKEAFDVFDQNRDGFIDERELQTVLRALGLKDRSDVKNCKRMISAFDENRDGRIDFKEFVKLMENSFC